jgi:Glycosyl hydrolase family 65, N-terminal domain./Glycosyl hydrolase family 65, C-terminal domain./Glycosyl hydrolase family 65 central catalytic domain.
MLDYTLGKGEWENWIVSETRFSPETLGKCEAIMALGNGYMGLRSATEEPYVKEVRNLFVNGTFNQFASNEVSELPNLADITQMYILVDGDRFSLESGKTGNYVRQLNLKTAELVRTITWKSPKGKTLHFHFRRFVSLENLHLIGMKMEVESEDALEFTFSSGINAQLTNSGTQHCLEGEKRIFDRRFLQLLQKTTESGIDIVVNTTHDVRRNGKAVDPKSMSIGRRQLSLAWTIALEPGDRLTVEKLSTVYTSRDSIFAGKPYELPALRNMSLEDLRNCSGDGYDKCFERHVRAWKEKVWDRYNLELDSENGFDELALRFAIYHLTIMTPAHDGRMGIGAKGLTGEGYKGHSFWDSEIFILPFFIFSAPEVARSLLIYRYLGLEGARKKARENGYEGAMYPWEAAWPPDGEQTPEWGGVDVVTGEQMRIWTGAIEHHITADIAFAVSQYHQVTGDEDFMNRYGYEMIFETAKFWASRLEWDEEKQEYHINDVIGPDEYKEHANNNAFTNYMAHYNLTLAISYYEKLKKQNPDLFAELNQRLGLKEAYPRWKERAAKLYLPKPREADSVIPQDDQYLNLKEIDLSKYKQQKHVGSIFRDYNIKQISELQVSKQADVVILLYLLEQMGKPVTRDVLRANFDYYEARTLHDSSLSLSTHAIVANDLGKTDFAYELFRKASEIDLGPNMHSSDDGIHAASIGGIWKTVVFGFAGIRLTGDHLRIHPRLPKAWRSLSFTIYWKGQPLLIEIDHSALKVRAMDGKPVSFTVFGNSFVCNDQMIIDYTNFIK